MAPVHSAVDVGAAIRGARLDRGWTQGELARRARAGRQWLVGVEAGAGNPSLDRLLAVLDALELTLLVASAAAAPVAPAEARRVPAREPLRGVSRPPAPADRSWLSRD